MIPFVPKGTYEEAVLYIDDIKAAVDKVEPRHAGFYVESAGVSTEKAIDAEIKGGLAKAGMLSIPLTIIILLFVLRSLVGAFIPLLLGLTSVAAASGLIALSSKFIPASESIMEVVLLVGLAVGVDYALFYMRREREERRAGRTETARARSRSGDVGPGRARLGDHRPDRDGRHVPLGRQDVHVLLGRRDDRRRRRAWSARSPSCPRSSAASATRSRRGGSPSPAGSRAAPRAASGAPSSSRVLKHPVVSAVAAAAVLLVMAAPVLSMHTAQTGIEGISSPAIEPFERLTDAFPGSSGPAVVAIKADDVNAPQVKEAIAELKQAALATGEMNNPIDVEVNPDHTVATVSVPLAGSGTDEESAHALATLRDEVIPATLGTVDGVDYAVTGATANSEDFNAGLSSSMPKVFGFVLLFAFGLLLVTFRSIVIAAKAIVLNLLSVGSRVRRASSRSSSGAGARACSTSTRTAASRTGSRCSCS